MEPAETIAPVPTTGPPHRRTGIDALRGIAVILMIQQHLLAWLWNAPRVTFPALVREYPLSMGLNLFGNLAAPLFIVLAGVGSSLFLERPGSRARTLVVRGVCIMLLGLALNLLAPYWFDPGSWYVLQLIGACLILSPALNRAPLWMIGALCLGVFAATPLVQTWLGTPIYLPEVRLNDASLPGGVLRLAVAEGHFPLLPWMSFFLLGIIAHRLFRREARTSITVLVATLITSGAALALLYRHGFAFATYGPLYRAFVFAPYFFPAHLPLILMLAGTALACTVAFSRPPDGGNGITLRVLSRFGRGSLSLFFFHVVLFNTLGRLLGVYRSFPVESAWLIIIGFLLVCAAALRPWNRHGLRYGLEWLVRLPEHLSIGKNQERKFGPYGAQCPKSREKSL